jgi:hypothetical protein
VSFNGADGISEIEGKAPRVGASERGQRASFNRSAEANVAQLPVATALRAVIDALSERRRTTSKMKIKRLFPLDRPYQFLIE